VRTRAKETLLILWSTPERGAASVEYAVLAASIAGVVVAGVFLVGQSTLGLFVSLLDAWQ
jgi:Flp pilus assembly pilin Flp